MKAGGAKVELLKRNHERLRAEQSENALLGREIGELYEARVSRTVLRGM